MKDAELRTALFRFLEDQQTQANRFADDLAKVKEDSPPEHKVEDLLDGQIRYLQNLLRVTTRLLRDIEAVTEGDEPLTPEAPNTEAQPSAAPVDNSSAMPLPLDAHEQELVSAYNEQSSKWTRTFKPVGFGAENVNEIWGNGGEPKFARKEGGIYNLIEVDGVCYVVPEPGLRLQESYFRSEGILYLFDLKGSSVESEPLISLVSPAKVEEAGGRWNILSKGEIRGRT